MIFNGGICSCATALVEDFLMIYNKVFDYNINVMRQPLCLMITSNQIRINNFVSVFNCTMVGRTHYVNVSVLIKFSQNTSVFT